MREIRTRGWLPTMAKESGKEDYFFSKWPYGKQCQQAAGDGFWKASGKEVPILSTGVHGGMPFMVGIKRTLVFYHGKEPHCKHTEWIMEVYRLAGAGVASYAMRPGGSSNRRPCGCATEITAKNDDALAKAVPAVVPNVAPDVSWVVCRITRAYNIEEETASSSNLKEETGSSN